MQINATDSLDISGITILDTNLNSRFGDSGQQIILTASSGNAGGFVALQCRNDIFAMLEDLALLTLLNVISPGDWQLSFAPTAHGLAIPGTPLGQASPMHLRKEHKPVVEYRDLNMAWCCSPALQNEVLCQEGVRCLLCRFRWRVSDDRATWQHTNCGETQNLYNLHVVRGTNRVCRRAVEKSFYMISCYLPPYLKRLMIPPESLSWQVISPFSIPPFRYGRCSLGWTCLSCVHSGPKDSDKSGHTFDSNYGGTSKCRHFSTNDHFSLTYGLIGMKRHPRVEPDTNLWTTAGKAVAAFWDGDEIYRWNWIRSFQPSFLKCVSNVQYGTTCVDSIAGSISKANKFKPC